MSKMTDVIEHELCKYLEVTAWFHHYLAQTSQYKVPLLPNL